MIYIYVCTVLLLRIVSNAVHSTPTLHGRYTRDITDYELTVPFRVNSHGDLLTFHLSEFFVTPGKYRSKRDDYQRVIHYKVMIDGIRHHLEVRPNHEFMSPSLVVERYDGSNVPVAKRNVRKITGKHCYFIGKVRGNYGSKVALSTCYGLAGHIQSDFGRYFIEPLYDHQPNENGEHIHIVYKRSTSLHGSLSPLHCATQTWTTSWHDRLMEKYAQRETNEPSNKTSNLHSLRRYVETLVVADKKFIDYHKHIDYERYILTIMNIVSSFFHDESIGNDVSIVVVRIIYIEREEEHMDLTVNPSAEDTLASFCRWQDGVNPQDVSNPQHHDVAVLLTRYDICSNNMTSCSLMGLAHVAGACSGSKQCSINEDSGLLLGVVVAHEMGHVMGCSHDEKTESGCDTKDSDGFYYVMSSYVHMNASRWSSCSRIFVTQFLESNLGDCLNDEPADTIHKLVDMLPGSVYDADFQCNMTYPGSKVCKRDEESFCKELFCEVKEGSCASNGEPPADGTKCGEKKWCFRAKCEEIGKRPEAVNGGWGDWGSWSKCSRTCGGGISYSERECDNPRPSHRGRYCIGERKKVKLCNKTPCEHSSKSFREAQCEEYNNKAYEGNNHTWKGYLKADDVCSLYCINEKSIYAKLAPRVVDGTSCKVGTKNKCIFGVCRKVGCDWIIDSDAIEDICGVCNGDGSMCTLHDETYKEPGTIGYKKIVTIPKGSKNIHIFEEAPSDNIISLTAFDEKTFYLNPNYTEQLNGYYDIGGTPGLYTHPEPDKESVYIAGPLPVDVIFFVAFFNKDNPGYRYKFAEPLSESVYKPKYHWEFLEWGDCSANCGGGVKVSKPQCVEEKSGAVVNSLCSALDKLEDRLEKCNEEPCKARWRTCSWSKCDGCKGRSGFKTRLVECVRVPAKNGEDGVVTEDGFCPEPKPASKKLCCSEKPCPEGIGSSDAFGVSQLWKQINSHPLAAEAFAFNRDIYVRKRKAYDNRTIRKNLLRFRTKYRNTKLSKRITNAWKRRILRKTDIVLDKVPPEQHLVVVPRKQVQDKVSLPDDVFESAGDKVLDSFDVCHKKIFTGKEVQVEKDKLKTSNETESDDT